MTYQKRTQLDALQIIDKAFLTASFPTFQDSMYPLKAALITVSYLSSSFCDIPGFCASSFCAGGSAIDVWLPALAEWLEFDLEA
jgi:hypothetical protein